MKKRKIRNQNIPTNPLDTHFIPTFFFLSFNCTQWRTCETNFMHLLAIFFLLILNTDFPRGMFSFPIPTSSIDVQVLIMHSVRHHHVYNFTMIFKLNIQLLMKSLTVKRNFLLFTSLNRKNLRSTINYYASYAYTFQRKLKKKNKKKKLFLLS